MLKKVLKKDKIARTINLTITKSFLSDRELDDKTLSYIGQIHDKLLSSQAEQLRDQVRQVKAEHIDERVSLSNEKVLDILTHSDSERGSSNQYTRFTLHSNLLKTLLGELVYKNFAPDVDLDGLAYLVIDSFNAFAMTDDTAIILAFEYDPELTTVRKISDAIDIIIRSFQFQLEQFSARVPVPHDDTSAELFDNEDVITSGFVPADLRDHKYGYLWQTPKVSDHEALLFALLPEHVDINLAF